MQFSQKKFCRCTCVCTKKECSSKHSKCKKPKHDRHKKFSADLIQSKSASCYNRFALIIYSQNVRLPHNLQILRSDKQSILDIFTNISKYRCCTNRQWLFTLSSQFYQYSFFSRILHHIKEHLKFVLCYHYDSHFYYDLGSSTNYNTSHSY